MTAFSADQTLPLPRVDPGEALPTLDLDYARRVRAAGHVRIGGGAIILNDAGEVYVQQHRGSDKTQDGAYGVITETVCWNGQAAAPAIEPVSATLSRGIYQERGGASLENLELRIAARDGYLLHACPVSFRNDSQTIMGIWAVMQLHGKDAQRFTDGFIANDEVRAGAFLSEADLRAIGPERYRFDLKPWLLRGIGEGLIAPLAGDTIRLDLSQANGGCTEDLDLNYLGAVERKSHSI